MTATTHNDDIAQRLIAHLENGTTDLAEHDLRVPVSNYVDPERLRAELALMRGLPLIVAHSSEVAEPGRFVTRTLLGTPLIILRQTDGTVAAYVNVCRHRGGTVEPERSGKKRFFTCHYHGWTYSRDGGTLRGVPYEDSFEPIDRACHSLRVVAAEEAHGFVWATLDGQPRQPVAEYLGPDVIEQLEPFRLEKTTVHLERVFDLDINWKIVVDGALDTLHPKFLHPKGVGKLLATNTTIWRDFGRHGQLFSPRTKLADKAREGVSLEELWRYVGMNIFVYPNNMVIAAPDHVEFWSVWPHPTDPAKCTAHIRFLIDPERVDDAMSARIAKSAEILEDAAINEDFPMEESIQRNSAAVPDGEYLYGRSELNSQHLHLQLARDLGS